LSVTVRVPSEAASRTRRSLSIEAPGRGSFAPAGSSSIVRAANPLKLDDLGFGARKLDQAPARLGERVEDRRFVLGAAGPEALQRPLGELRHGPLQRLVADEHVAVSLVAGAAADRVVGVVSQQLAPGQPEVAIQGRLATVQLLDRGERLHREQPALGALVGLLEVQPRRVDAAQDVLEPAAEELAGPRWNVGRAHCGYVLAVARDLELRVGQASLELRAQRRQVRLDREVV
jgi:hypothetical protein